MVVLKFNVKWTILSELYTISILAFGGQSCC